MQAEITIDGKIRKVISTHFKHKFSFIVEGFFLGTFSCLDLPNSVN